MCMNVLVLNAGSSTLKFQIIATDLEAIENNSDRRLAKGTIERIGGEGILTLQPGSEKPRRLTATLRDLHAAVDYLLRWSCSESSGIPELKSVGDIHVVGHRV